MKPLTETDSEHPSIKKWEVTRNLTWTSPWYDQRFSQPLTNRPISMAYTVQFLEIRKKTDHQPTKFSESELRDLGEYVLFFKAFRDPIRSHTGIAWDYLQKEYMRNMYEIQHIHLAPNVWLHSSVGRASHRYSRGHGFESHWSPDIFQASSFQLLKLENLVWWSLFTLKKSTI